MNRLLVIPSILFFALGIVGLLIPVVPQIPFFIISILFMASASDKFKRYIVSKKIYKDHIKKYVDRSELLSSLMEDDNNSNIE